MEARKAEMTRRTRVRRILILGLPAVMALAGGCQRSARTLPADVAGPPIALDPAMQRRDWETSHAYFANGNVDAGPTRFTFTERTTEGTSRLSGKYSYLLDSAFFAYQSLRLPFTYLAVKPFAPRTYTGVEYEETYTAAPPIAGAGPSDPSYVGTGMVGGRRTSAQVSSPTSK